MFENDPRNVFENDPPAGNKNDLERLLLFWAAILSLDSFSSITMVFSSSTFVMMCIYSGLNRYHIMNHDILSYQKPTCISVLVVYVVIVCLPRKQQYNSCHSGACVAQHEFVMAWWPCVDGCWTRHLSWVAGGLVGWVGIWLGWVGWQVGWHPKFGTWFWNQLKHIHRKEVDSSTEKRLIELFIYEGRSNGIRIYGHSPLICPRHSAVFGLVQEKES